MTCPSDQLVHTALVELEIYLQSVDSAYFARLAEDIMHHLVLSKSMLFQVVFIEVLNPSRMPRSIFVAMTSH